MKTIYYDPAYRGIDLNAHFAAAEAKLAEATSLSQAHLRRFPYLLRPANASRYGGLRLGDQTSGLTMQARVVSAVVRSVDGFIPYGAAVSDADPIMGDGKSIEGVGVTPDELLLPTQADLAGGRDPVLARAVTMLGGTLDPVAAAKLLTAVK